MRLNEIFETYKNDVQFQLIYVCEAHPADGWQTPQNLYEEVVFDAPTNADERAEIGNACQIGLDLKYPMLIDTIDDEVEKKYVASPIRLYVIDANGIITFVCAAGPRGFDPDGWEAAIKEQISG
ncbi:MAG: deiodinase [Rhodospirillaceae bacterium]|nr:deiodinase [Rhodospirillaceae bacterium]